MARRIGVKRMLWDRSGCPGCKDYRLALPGSPWEALLPSLLPSLLVVGFGFGF